LELCEDIAGYDVVEISRLHANLLCVERPR